MIGLFPGGCTEEDLNFLWGSDWMLHAERLLKASLLIKRNDLSGDIVKYTLLPFMNRYAEELMEEKERKKWHNKCCNYLARICKNLFNLN